MASSTQDATLLGVCDGEIDRHRHRSSFLTNKVGGAPDWLPPLPRGPPRCGRCGAAAALVVQVYCPLQGSPYHRNLHLFACPRPDCCGRSECWTALRSQCLEAEAEAAAAAGTSGRAAPLVPAAAAATDWCDTADDWGTEEEEEDGGWGAGPRRDDRVQEQPDAQRLARATTAAPDATAAAPDAAAVDASRLLQDLRLAEAPEDAPVFRPFFISVVEESDVGGEEQEEELMHAQELLRDYERREGLAVAELDGGVGGGGEEEKYEKTGARHGDAVFSGFMKKISLCPQQVLRYCRGGQPVFVSAPPSHMAQLVEPCGACGGPRTFELQLMPALVSLLRRQDGGHDGGGEAELEFGTVLVYTCARSCWGAGSGSGAEEFCFAQADPDQQLFKCS